MSSKEAYEQKLRARLDEWSADIDKLKAKARQADAEAKIKIENEIEEAEAKQEQVEEKLDELRSSTDDAWTDIKDGLDAASSSLSASVRSAMARFS